MKKTRKIILAVLIFLLTILLLIVALYNYLLAPISNQENKKNIVIPHGTSSMQIASILKENNLIKSKDFFVMYLKINNINNLKATTYQISPNMSMKTIIDLMKKGNDFNENEFYITFKEGINMRQIAYVISQNTDFTEKEVIDKSNDIQFIDKMIDKYWFITNDIKNKEIYYKLEGYLFPETYSFFKDKVTIEMIFEKMIKQMEIELEPYKSQFENNKFTVHQLFTLASMIEKEGGLAKDRSNIASVFVNRINKKDILGSDVTTRYALKKADTEKLTSAQYQTKSPYNTRLLDGSMNGKFPVGPISTISKSSINASVNYQKTNYLYFIANIKTKETFFFADYKDFNNKKNELASVNQGY